MDTRIDDRILLHTSETERRLVDPADIYLIEADGSATRVRFRRKRAVRDVREMAALEALLAPFGFVRTHRGHLVNVRRIAVLRKRNARDWELKMQPPAGRVLPVSRTGLAALRKVLGDG